MAKGASVLLGRLDHVVVFVKDLKRATAFYRDVLGLRVALETPGFVGVMAGEQMIGLHPTETGGSDVGHGPVPYFAVDDMAGTVAELRSRGVHIHMEPTRPANGPLIASIHDSEGNALGLVQHGA